MKKLFLLILLSVSLLPLAAQTAREVLISMPDSLMPLLPVKSRHDMLDFLDNKMEAKVRNRLNDYVCLDTLTEDYFRLSLSEAAETEMRILRTEDSLSVICLVHTVGTSIRDSRAAFYDNKWHLLHWLKLPNPSTEDFFSMEKNEFDSLSVSSNIVATDTRDWEWMQRSINDLRFVEITIAPDAPVFTFTLSLEPLAEEEKKLALRYVRPLQYRWTGNDFMVMPSH